MKSCTNTGWLGMRGYAGREKRWGRGETSSPIVQHILQEELAVIGNRIVHCSVRPKGSVAVRWMAALIISVVALIPQTASAQEARWYAEFFSNRSLSGTPVVTRWDSRIDFNWGSGAPAAGVPADDFSARWTRTEYFDGGTYRFYARADDGFRLWVGSNLVIDSWVDQQGGWITRDVYLNQGGYQVRAEYYEHQGGALVTLHWERLSGGAGWLGEYFDNRNLSGQPILRRSDAAIDFAWGSGSPAPNVPSDNFSVRWTRSAGFTAGTYRFLTSTDDGVRLWVDDRLVIDAWHNQSLPNTHVGTLALTEGLHNVKVEYYEAGGEAHAHVWWEKIDARYSGWKGEYFSNHTLTGDPALVRDDSEINFDWGTGSPVSWMPADHFSARWTRQVRFDPGYYRLSVRSDDGVRVWLDHGLVIDKWTVMNNELHYVDGIYLNGVHQLKIEYFENTGHARVRFWVERSGGSPPPATPPSAGAVVVDDTDPGFVTGGSPSGWRVSSIGYGGRMTWTRNNDHQRSNYNWARWYPNLEAGRYEVFAYIPERNASTRHANYWISHADGYSLRTVNQSIYYGEWVSLGTYRFRGTGQDYVSLSDITGETYLSRTIGFDAVRWEPR